MGTTDNNIIDLELDLSPIRKKSIRIDGDDSRILYLNTSDMNIIARMNDLYPKLKELAEDATKELPKSDDIEKEFADMAEHFTDIDKRMRETMDELFDGNVSEVCAPSGNMYDIINGGFRYEFIMDSLLKLYSDNIEKETKKIQKRMQSHTDKYTKGGKRK
jgi:hypothetical protein